jgi:murein DD-endopeptidase MepM/ murein hydrolase activator NlpD
MDLRRRRALWLLGALAWLTAGPLLAAWPAAGAAGWRWPLDPPVAVVAGFAAPAGPFAPGHRGVDLGGRVGDPVRSAAAGVAAFAGRVAGRGVVSVDHPGGLRTSYEPVTATVAQGDQVGAGAVLGRLESVASHCPPAACLHWGLRRGGTYLDPRSMLGEVRVRLLPVWGSAGPAAVPAAAAKVPAGAAERPDPSARRPASGTRGGDSGSGAARLAVGAAAAAVGTAGVLLGRRRAPP